MRQRRDDELVLPSADEAKGRWRKSPRRYAHRRLKRLAREVGPQRRGQKVLLFRKRKQYLRGIQDALAGAEAARVVLAGRLEDPFGPARRASSSESRSGSGRYGVVNSWGVVNRRV